MRTRWSSAIAILRRRLRYEQEEQHLLHGADAMPAPERRATADAAADDGVVVTRVAVWLPEDAIRADAAPPSQRPGFDRNDCCKREDW